jgi:transcription elongation factor GreA
MKKETLITPAGLSRLCEELDRLRTAGRQEIADRIRNVMSTESDASSSSDYQFAREEQAHLELRIARLEERLASTRVALREPRNGTVELGERVRVCDLDSGSDAEYELVGSFEADPGVGRISAESPVGRALIGRGPGEVAVVQTPRGTVRLRIVEIELPGVAA